MDIALEKLVFETAESRADANNLRSVAATKSIGCLQEGN